MNNPSSRAFVLARCPVTSPSKQSPSWYAEWPGNSLDFLLYPAYHYRAHKGTPGPYVSQMNLANTFMSTTNPRHLV
jgi:hypothetical protein